MTHPQSPTATKIVERLEHAQAFLDTLADLRSLIDDLDVRSEPRLTPRTSGP